MADAEDESVVQGDVGALRLCDIEIVALGVWRGVEGQESVWRVAAGMGHGEAESQSMRIHLVGVLKQLAVSRFQTATELTINPLGPA